MTRNDDDLVTGPELAQILGVTRQSISRAGAEGRLPVASTRGRSRLYSLRAVAAHLKGLVRST